MEEPGEHRDRTEAIPPGTLFDGCPRANRGRGGDGIGSWSWRRIHVSAARYVPLDRLMKPAHGEASFWTWVQTDHTWSCSHDWCLWATVPSCIGGASIGLSRLIY